MNISNFLVIVGVLCIVAASGLSTFGIRSVDFGYVGIAFFVLGLLGKLGKSMNDSDK